MRVDDADVQRCKLNMLMEAARLLIDLVVADKRVLQPHHKHASAVLCCVAVGSHRTAALLLSTTNGSPLVVDLRPR